MNVAHLRIKDFRNHSDTSVEFGPGINALFGANGQGKTNIVEAISYLSLTKSFYAANDATVLQIGKEIFEVEGTLITDAGIENSIRAAYIGSSGEKRFTVNRSKPETLASVIGRFPIVVLSPENSAITLGGPAERRRFLDLLLSQISRPYFEDLLEYRRALKQRNKLLLDAKLGRSYSSSLIDPWSINLVRYGSRIIHRRQQLVEEFQPYVIRAYRELVRDREKPSLDYVSLPGIDTLSDPETIASLMSEEITLRHADELRRGTTLAGPHRDDLSLCINGVSVQRYASQGQHKTFLVALKTAEFFYIREQRRETPIFLLDDVFSELDPHRSRNVVGLIADLGQAILTTADESVFQGAVQWNAYHRRFYVENGTCRPA
ncbi:MAG: DNA replication/repair protein RecF [Ignavibacteriae bacterium]|nr:DNA replication/repair protein RecF [Ignavibacteriota bacterium]